MNFYLSSYKIGSKEAVEKLKNLIPFNKKTAYISNAFDFANDIQRRKENEEEDIKEIESIGLKIEYFDLRKYFNQPDNLEKDLKHFGVIWVSGGNVFVLRQAMKLSGFDQILIKLNQEKNNILYCGYSAGICVLGPSLKGLELVDNPKIFPYSQQK